MSIELSPRLLRVFVAVAGELHFGRAAARLHVAQQALSRDVRKLEDILGTALFTRSTRRVELTTAGARLLPKARRLLADHDALVAEFRPRSRPLLVDLNGEGMATGRILAGARDLDPEVELLARYRGGLAAAAAEILAGRLDVSFGRFAGLGETARRSLAQRPVKFDRIAVLLPDDHPLATLDAIPLSVLTGHRVDISAGNPATTEWTDLGARLLTEGGIAPAEPHAPPDGPAEMAHYLRRHREPVLFNTDIPAPPGSVVRPIVEPVPLSLVSIVHPPGLRHPGLDALNRAIRRLSAAEGWLDRPAGSWLPEADGALLP